ncbi:MAG: alpha-1,4-glucan--maltose-1-phosphate maltosyltransferase [Candidatus Dormibacteria bacterium]
MISTTRVAIESVRPSVHPQGFAAKALCGQLTSVSADIFVDGHDRLAAWVGAWPVGDPARRLETPLVSGVNDRWHAAFIPDQVGLWNFEVGAHPDRYGTWLRDTAVKAAAGQDVGLELEEGALLAEVQAAAATDRGDVSALRKVARGLRSKGAAESRVAAAGTEQVVALMRRTAGRGDATIVGPLPLWVDRVLAGFSAWYEFFPRSEGASPAPGGKPSSGTFRTASRRLRAIADMGFDIVYLPPIHPIGSSFRKGPNNSLNAAPGDPGSPWAIGSAAGGHTAVHPDLGSLADFDDFVAEAKSLGLEVALDYALQCSPDHPWVAEHPSWFSHRPDGSIKYAENPPKKYQDIFPINFETEDQAGLWQELKRVIDFWIDHGVQVFRVDNPHTKALPFWEWLIESTHRQHPDVLFLAEAFTRPRMMERLAKLGFSQSYTYFTWRNTKSELSEYLQELSQGPMVDYFRPNFWPNTPDILHAYLQRGGRAAFQVRAVLAAMAGPSWGIYSGFELVENIPVREGSEEYMDSEKYQYRPRQWDVADSLVPLVTRLNAVRRRHAAAVAALRTLRLHHVSGEDILGFSRTDPGSGDSLLVLVNTDPYNAHEGTTWLDLPALGLADEQAFEVVDELTGETYTWHGAANYVRLDPRESVAHVFALRTGRDAS